MDRTRMELTNEFGGVWVKVKFYEKIPDKPDYEVMEGVRFCEAIPKARLSPIILRSRDISCAGARYVFNWNHNLDKEVITTCSDGRGVSCDIARSMLLSSPRLKIPPKAIGLNVDDIPDLFISYLQPEGFMNLLKVFQDHEGKNLVVSLSSTMGVCGNVAVNAYHERKISISFGCDESRKYGRMSRDRLAVGVPYSELRKLALISI